MSEPAFKPDKSIYQNREALNEEWTPNEIVGRDQELAEYKQALQPVINNEQPSNIFIYGKSGTGKTAATRFLLKLLERDAQQVAGLDLHTLEINCDGLNTSYQTAIKITNFFREPDNHLPETGHPQSAVYNKLYQELDDLGGTILLVLDEVDHLNDDSLLYQLPRARSNGYITDTKIGVIGISNDLDFRKSLSRKVRSSLCEKELTFSTYTAAQLRDVLRQREEVAFYDDVLDEGVISMCAEYGAKDAGDARTAIDLLREAGDIARGKHADTVTTDHVTAGRQKLQSDIVVDHIKKYTDHGKLILAAVLELHEEGETPARTREVEAKYHDLVLEYADGDPVGERALRDYLSDFEQQNITTAKERNLGKPEGRFKIHSLKKPPEVVKKGLGQVLALPLYETSDVEEPVDDRTAKQA